jgi:2-polyprenyl-3-methyl-5-hydroxy-6-metoxy-1,4-benzoquinol methylase
VASEDLKTEELTAIVQEIRERVRARHPEGSAAGVALPDLMPVVHARDAAQAKVAAIGTVNPRPPGLINHAIQALKRLVARLLDWHVRDQVEFNRGVMDALEAILQALSENNRALARLASQDEELRQQEQALLEEFRAGAQELKDVRTHWAEWRAGWEQKLATNEIQFLRAVADLQGAFQHRVTLMESNLRDLVRSQHADFTGALDRAGTEIQKRLWADLERIRVDFERLIHAELRLVRQRAALGPPAAAPPAEQFPERPPIDWLAFAERFRGSREHVQERQRIYVPRFAGCQAVLDLGCGRGEFLELMKEAGIRARGIDEHAEAVALCRERGLEAEQAEIFSHLGGLPDTSLDGIFCAQVIEHLPPERVPELVRLAAAKLQRGGLLVVETPNPERLAIFATHFYLDPTHQRPVPPALLVFYLEEAGFGGIEVERFPPDGLDYAVFARKLG